MVRSLTMPTNPAASTFPDFLRERFGPKWVLAPRMTERFHQAGHERNITRKQYDAAEREWETLAYGAPLKSLEAAAPAMLAALRAIIGAGSFHDDGTFVVEMGADHDTITNALAAIAQAEGRAP